MKRKKSSLDIVLKVILDLLILINVALIAFVIVQGL